MTSATRDRIAALMAQGVQQSVIAEACAVDPSYISQLKEEPAFLETLSSLRSARLEHDIRYDEEVDGIEKDALRMIGKKLPFVRSAGEAAAVFKTINAARRRAINNSNGDAAGDGRSVTLNLPRAAQVLVQVNSNNQVIAVNGVSTAPLPSRVLPTLARETARTTVTLPALTARIPSPEHAAVKEALKQEDIQRANSIMDNLTVVLNGKEIAI